MNDSVWKKVGQKEKISGKIFRYEIHDFESPLSGKRGAFDILKVASWVNVVAITSKEKFVMVKQFRAGTSNMTLEIPGGAIDPGEQPLAVAKRELEEESGYQSNSWTELGCVHPNPAFMNNTCWTFLATDCTPTGKMNLDPLEEIEVCLLDWQEIDTKIASGGISHGLVLNALYFYQRYFT